MPESTEKKSERPEWLDEMVCRHGDDPRSCTMCDIARHPESYEDWER